LGLGKTLLYPPPSKFVGLASHQYIKEYNYDTYMGKCIDKNSIL